MLDVVNKIVTFAIMPVSGFFVIKNLTNSDEKIFKLKNLFIILLLTAFNMLVYNINYSSITTILNVCAIIVGYKYIFKISLFDSFLLSIILMIFVFVSDLLVYILMSTIFGADAIRNIGLIMILSNISVGIISILISMIKSIKKVINKLMEKLERKIKFQFVLLSALWIIVISILCYTIFSSPKTDFSFWIFVIIEVVFIIFLIIYFKNQNEYIRLNKKFDELYDYIQTMEEYLEDEELNIHEYKNQLTVIKDMTKEKKVKEYISSLVEINNPINEWSGSLKRLPKGGLKGLIYYKLAVAKQKNLNVVIDVSDKITNKLKELNLETIKNLSRLIGIYLDNSIEASGESTNKMLSVEFYLKEQKINIVISNTFANKPNINKINKKGYTTKGKDRGKGLYFASKITKPDSNIEASSSIINDFYVQRIILKQTIKR